MRVLEKFPHAMGRLERSGHPHHVPIQCDCGVTLAHEHSRNAGATHGTVTCPACKRSEEVPLQDMCAFLGASDA